MEMSCVEQVAPNDLPTEPGTALGMAQVLGCQEKVGLCGGH